MIFLFMMSFLFGAAYIGRNSGYASTWTIVFSIGASTTGIYLILALLTLSEKMRSRIFFSKTRVKILLLTILFAPILGGTLYWISRAGSVEALPIFPLFIGIFYAWILSQAYFIATPVSQALVRLERGVIGEGNVRRILRALGSTVLFLPIAPLAIGVWEISTWASQNYQTIQGASTKILEWTVILFALLATTYLITVRWGWKSIKRNKPESAIYAGGLFLILWAYLLYRGTSFLIGFVGQNQPASVLIDVGLMVVSILGAMQTFARKTINRADRRWSQALPFFVFSFGSVYAVAQFYFILQVALTRTDLSIIVNGLVFGAGLLTMILLIRSHLSLPRTSPTTGPAIATTSLPEAESSPEPEATTAPSPSSETHDGEQIGEESPQEDQPNWETSSR